MRSITAAVVLVLLVALSTAEAQPDADMSDDMTLINASRLEAGAVADLEKQLAADSNDRQARLKLLGYYNRRRFQDDAAREKHVEHALWFIGHEPRGQVAGRPFTHIEPAFSPEGYVKGKALWLEQVWNHRRDAQIHANAAKYLQRHDDDEAERLLKAAKTLEPANGEWPEQLAQLYTLRAISEEEAAAKELHAKALAELELALHAATRPEKRFYLLNDLAVAALEAGDLDKAKRYAQDSVRTAERYPRDWNRGNAVHDGHGVLGRVALREGDRDAAKRHLLEAAKAPGSPQLNSFGPDLTFADEMLQAGEADAVVEYLRGVATFWAGGAPAIDRWIAAIEKGERPTLDRFAAMRGE